MIGLTSMASTPLMEQKQKADFKSEPSVQVEFVNVELGFVAYEATFNKSNDIVLQFVKETKLINPVSSINDVGWHSLKQSYNLDFNQRNLLKNKLISFVYLIDKANKIRDNC